MHFTIGMIRDALAAGGLTLETALPSARRFRDFRPLRPDGAAREDCLYVVSGGTEGVCRAELSGIPALLYAPEPSAALALLSDRAEELREWNETVLRLLLRGRSLAEVLGRSVPLFKNPLHVTDSGFRTRAMSTNYDFARFRDGEAAYLHAHGLHSPEYVSKILDDPWFRALSAGPRRAAIHQFDFLAHRNILSVIGDETRTFGYLTVIEQETPLTEGMVDLAEHLSGLLANTFAGERGALSPGHDQMDSTLFRDVLRGDVTDLSQIRAAFQRSGLPEGHRFLVAALEVEPGGERDDFFLLCVADQLAAGLEGCRCVIVDGCIAVVLRADDPEQARLRLLGCCREQLFLSRARRGFSLPFAELGDVSLFYRQARAALRFGALVSGEALHAGYDEVALYDLLEHFGDARARRALLHPAIELLERHDRERGGYLLDTLRVLLRCRGDANAAAEALYLHRNSLYYRVSQILAVAGVDPRDGRTAEMLSISLCIHDMDARPEEA